MDLVIISSAINTCSAPLSYYLYAWNPQFSKKDVIVDTYNFMSSITDNKIMDYLI